MSNKKPYLLRIPERIQRDLDAFAQAHHGASKNRLILDAIELLMAKELEEDPGLRARFEQALGGPDEGEARTLKIVHAGPGVP